jgi:hypothetical protein
MLGSMSDYIHIPTVMPALVRSRTVLEDMLQPSPLEFNIVTNSTPVLANLLVQFVNSVVHQR